MAKIIGDDTIESIGILTQLELTDKEKAQAKRDMEKMLNYMDKLGELDMSTVEPLAHLFPGANVFREDVVTNGDDSENMLKNAPSCRRQMFVVPRTV